MEQNNSLELAMKTLEEFALSLARGAGESEGYGTFFWERLRKSHGILSEFAYYHDHGEFLCEEKVSGFTIADVLVWQVDHFKAYLDRPEDMNRYRQERLLLSAFDILLKMEKEPEKFAEKMKQESGTDFVGKY